jgi:hypothetical protein
MNTLPQEMETLQENTKIDVDEILNNLMMYLKNGMDPNDLIECEINFLNEWLPNWKSIIE